MKIEDIVNCNRVNFETGEITNRKIFLFLIAVPTLKTKEEVNENEHAMMPKL